MKEKIALAPEIVLKCIEIHWKEENHDNITGIWHSGNITGCQFQRGQKTISTADAPGSSGFSCIWYRGISVYGTGDQWGIWDTSQGRSGDRCTCPETKLTEFIGRKKAVSNSLPDCMACKIWTKPKECRDGLGCSGKYRGLYQAENFS